MRVIVNADCARRSRAGIGHYTTELVRCLRASAGAAAVDTFYPPDPPAGFWCRHVERYLARRGRPGVLPRLESLARRAYLAAFRRAAGLFAPRLIAPADLPVDVFAAAVRAGRHDLYHEPNFLPYPCDRPTVVSVHDLSVLVRPDWHPPERVEQFARRFERGLRQACHLVAISEFGKAEIVRHLGWPADKVTVTYMGVRPGLRPVPPRECAPVLRRLGLEPGYLLHVGTREPRKNLAMLVGAYGALPAAVRDRHPLVLVGGPGWNSADLEDLLAARGEEWNVRRPGYVPDEDLPAVYSAARALVFPTFYEGFGMPTIEMLACGGAVLASTAGAVAETVGGAAHLLDPDDADGWRAAMLRVCTDDDWWRALRVGAEDAARPFTWERCAEQTLVAYRRALGQADPARRAA
ncbi:MAG: glycosyltransferase family 1 protein [Isosphaera sp.]|nr:glycosyltransferase family 1 protein [Isosphaera sp.]